MKRWSWSLICPKCGMADMKPEWSGMLVEPVGGERQYLDDGFRARCVYCEYLEEVLPLDAPDGEAQ